ncbi:pyrroline-5-carboxylate reductase [Leucobacter sp. CX169]|uniref:pyrroline-5-carboxylate reductase n=1 Tax=Leucobacter sp. CX169 TaxID=2813744 RepID=UPI002111E91D|nr:pyrroline-5-carboxylate reductase [Leucobacter sp. CX169]
MTDTTEICPLPTTAILGLGSMGRAILHGMRAPGVSVDGPIRVTTRSIDSASALTGIEGVVPLATEASPDANREAVAGARMVILAVKPWMIHDVLREVADSLAPGAVVVSVAAGITTASMEALVPEGISVLRAMPNTPALIGRGVTGIAAGATADAAATEAARAHFSTVGEVLVVDEGRIDALSAISGSGPAYVYLFIEELTAAAVRLGFTDDEARVMVQGTFAGASELAAQSADSPAELRRQVTSPKGTTAEAIGVLQGADLPALFDAALAAAIARAGELAAG